ncbi:hypothetical protein [Geodermatophilus sp. FMUSA9-8]|uniref:hypothetical protein n=1 Tax=Geodermatophilus sp. FMUSA9-8 TaxID=3120155 RepID=UPI003008AD0C
MRRSLVAATAASVLLLTAACGGSSGGGSGSGAEGGDRLTLAAVTPPSSFAIGEMAQSGPEDHYYQAVYDTLLELDEDGQPVENLVTEWSYDDSNTRLSLTLRDDVIFSDGTPFDAGYADGFSMTLPDFSPVYPDEQAAMTEAFSSLGIEVTYAPITGDQVVGSIIGGQWPANFFNLTAGSPFEMIGLTLTQQSPFNPFKSADPEVDRLVQQAQAASGDEQAAALQELNRHLVEQAWFAPWDAAEGTFITTTDVAVTAVPGVSVPPLTGFEPAGS